MHAPLRLVVVVLIVAASAAAQSGSTQPSHFPSPASARNPATMESEQHPIGAAVATTHPTSQPKHTNRLSQETSPYLLQHAHNPVDWYPWGPEAFEAARQQNKPIFLSVGYSTCYWCHVMERQCFENEAIAAEMNKRFINIKVDREERPDVDQLYMTAVQVLTRHGGWPMSVFLTPDLRPFYGGTYFPPQDMHGRPGFPRVLQGIEDAYHNRKGEVEETANQLVQILTQLAEPTAPRSPVIVGRDLIDRIIDDCVSDFDQAHGGFGGAPKFPRQTLLELLLTYCRGEGNADVVDARTQTRRGGIQKMVLHTLDALAAGGIHDQLGGGFHRYSTDAKWLVPHFEIMLYDNAMLAWCYVEAYRQTEDPKYADVARGIFEFILREMTSPQGAFYTAFDAEVDAQEGLSYLWTKEEIEQLLGRDDAAIFNRVYGVDRGPNFADPHHGNGTPDKNILYLPTPLEEVATSQTLRDRLAQMRQTLYTARLKRKQPLLDTKIITSWNALMIRAFAYGGQHLGEPRYIDVAQRAADYLLSQHRKPDGTLYRTSRDGQQKYDAFLDDYAFLAQAMIAIHRAGGSVRYRDAAAALALIMREKFADTDGGFYFTSADARDLIVRQKVGTDSPLPSGNAIAAAVMNELGHPDVTRQTLAIFAEPMRGMGEGMSSMVKAAMSYLESNESFTVSSAPPVPSTGPTTAPVSPRQAAADVVDLSAEWDGPKVLRVTVRVKDGYHINAHQTAEGLIPTQLAVSGDNVSVQLIDYPPGEEQRFAFSDEALRVYGDETMIAVHLRSVTSGSRVRLSLSYQACDDSACLAPAVKQIEVAAP